MSWIQGHPEYGFNFKVDIYLLLSMNKPISHSRPSFRMTGYLTRILKGNYTSPAKLKHRPSFNLLLRYNTDELFFVCGNRFIGLPKVDLG